VVSACGAQKARGDVVGWHPRDGIEGAEKRRAQDGAGLGRAVLRRPNRSRGFVAHLFCAWAESGKEGESTPCAVTVRVMQGDEEGCDCPRASIETRYGKGGAALSAT